MGSPWLGPAFVGALFGALATAFGLWLGWRDRRDASAQRAKRSVDLARALRAEVRAELANLRSVDVAAHMGAISEPLRAGAPVLISGAPESVVFAAFVREIDLLPTEAIEAVVAYQRQRAAIRSFADILRRPNFDALDGARREAAYRDYLAMHMMAAELAATALAALETAAETPR